MRARATSRRDTDHTGPAQTSSRPRPGTLNHYIRWRNQSDLGADLEVGEELDGALAGDEVVVDNAAEGEHGEAAVLDLLELVAGPVLPFASVKNRDRKITIVTNTRSRDKTKRDVFCGEAKELVVWLVGRGHECPHNQEANLPHADRLYVR